VPGRVLRLGSVLGLTRPGPAAWRTGLAAGRGVGDGLQDLAPRGEQRTSGGGELGGDPGSAGRRGGPASRAVPAFGGVGGRLSDRLSPDVVVVLPGTRPRDPPGDPLAQGVEELGRLGEEVIRITHVVDFPTSGSVPQRMVTV